MASQVKDFASKILHHSRNSEPITNSDTVQGRLTDHTSASKMSNLPQEYTVASFESKGEPLTFKKVTLKLPKEGEVCSLSYLLAQD